MADSVPASTDQNVAITESMHHVRHGQERRVPAQPCVPAQELCDGMRKAPASELAGAPNVELRGIEPLTSSLRTTRSTN